MNYEDRVTKGYIEAAIPKIKVGSYVGTGEYGSNHQNSITLDFQPKLLLFPTISTYVYEMYSGEASISCITWGQTDKFVQGDQSRGVNTLSFSGNTIFWYNSYGASYQRNALGQTYYYVAFG